MIINDEIVDLTNIKHPLYLYAGKDDEITSSQQLFDISKYVSSTIINKYLLPNCGHTRVFTGNLELELFKNTFL
jgi:poly(3-hydroxyalkanoate) synthetase